MTSISLPLLTGISQWALFMGLAAIIFGWTEKKENFALAGHIIFLLLGLLAAWILCSHSIDTSGIQEDVVSKELKALAFFKGLVALALMNVISLTLKLFQPRYLRISQYLVVFIALLLFFLVVNTQQMAN